MGFSAKTADLDLDQQLRIDEWIVDSIFYTFFLLGICWLALNDTSLYFYSANKSIL